MAPSSRRRRAVLLCTCVSLGACSFFVPDVESAAGRARRVERKCGGFAEDTVAPLLSSSAVDSVEPAYSYVSGGPNGREAHLRGARMHVRPLPGLTREAIARNLECHEARAILGVATIRGDDPYVLADRWLTIDVESEGDGFVVLVLADDLDSARRVLERARVYAGARARN